MAFRIMLCLIVHILMSTLFQKSFVTLSTSIVRERFILENLNNIVVEEPSRAFDKAIALSHATNFFLYAR